MARFKDDGEQFALLCSLHSRLELRVLLLLHMTDAKEAKQV